MASQAWSFIDDLRLVMLCRPRPDERDIRRLARDLGRHRADVRRRRRVLRSGARVRDGLGGRR